MQLPRYTKQLLYDEIESFRCFAGVRLQDYPLDTKALANAGGLTVDTCDFKTKGLKGILAIVESQGYIILDSKESPREQNFFCGHEILHFTLHRNIGANSFQCYESVKSQQNAIIEWQANEGAAELIVPYRQFIPDFLDLFNPITGSGDIFYALFSLAEKYHVTETVIKNRIENLKYEIFQVANGCHMDSVKIMSNNQQKKQGIHVPSYYDIGLEKHFLGMA